MLLLLPLMGAALGAFAETAYVFPEDKVTKEKPGIRIRGVKSSSGKEPLVLVDGRETVLDSIKTEQIKTITVLKDSTVVAVYGEKGRNGVILVEMKKDTEPASMYLEVKKAKVVSGKSGTVIVSDSVGTVVTAGKPEEVTVVGYGMKSKEGMSYGSGGIGDRIPERSFIWSTGSGCRRSSRSIPTGLRVSRC